jgi:ElaB/YqjD/DUF883 family membrane-anchored ribosome-binding protein
MPVADDTIETPKPSTAGHIADAVRHAAHLSHEARLLGSMARDAGEEGVYAAKRAMRRVQHGIDTLQDLSDDAAHYVKRQPFKAIGIALSVGVPIGILIGWLGRRVIQKTQG